MYKNGQGVAQDDIRAHMWLNLASWSGDTDAANNLILVASKMTPQRKAEAQKLEQDCRARDFKGCN
jgi:TPR repeat protein